MSKPEFVYITYIETTPDKLWQALTESSFTRQYWWGTNLETDWKVGSPIALVSNGKTTDTGKILAFDPPHMMSYTIHHELSDASRKEKPSRVTIKLQPAGKLVKLILTHEDFESSSVVLPGISSGWPAILASLKSLLERGEALSIPATCL
jgi:uncharacterized protein YndB with AHSA1/START domain